MKRCPSCQAIYPDDAAWCPVEGARLEPVPFAPHPASITAGWDIPDVPVAPAPTKPAAARLEPSAGITAGWDIPDVPVAPASPPAPAKPAAARTAPSAGITAGWDIPDLPAAPAPHPARTAPSAGITAGWDIPDVPVEPAAAHAAVLRPAPPPGAITAGWDVPDVQAEPGPAPAPVSTARLPDKPGAVTAGWDIPGVPVDPAPQISASALAAAAASPFRPGEKVTSPSSTLPGFAPPAEMQAILIARRQQQLAAQRPQPSATPIVDPAYAAAAQQSEQPAPMHGDPQHAAQPYAAAQQPQTPYAQPYGAARSGSPYGAAQSASPYGAAPASAYDGPQQPYGAGAQPGSPHAPQPASPHGGGAQQHVQHPPPAFAHGQHAGSSAPSASAPSASVEKELRAAKRNPTLWIVLALVVIGALVTVIVLATR